jgi:basic membrane lipoprotein Med (substrate-binding protein (PBP1-ABC) superfamily)
MATLNPRLSRRDFGRLAGASLLAPRVANAAGSMAPVDPNSAVIAFGHVGPISDEGWTYTHHLGLLAVKQAYPHATFLEVESIPYSADATRTFRRFVAQGANIVFLSSEYGDLLYPVSNRTPQIAWLECDGHTLGFNRGAYYIKHWMPSYVAGIAAGLMSKTGRLGYVGSMAVPTTFAGVNAFLMGAQSVKPHATMQVILINAWFDPQAAAQAGTALIDNGADVLLGAMDEAAYLQVAEKRGVPAVMWNSDGLRRYGPKSYITAVVLDWNAFYIAQTKARLEGSWTPAQTLLALGAGVDRAPWGDSVPEPVRRQADAVRTRMLGGWTPFVGEIKDTQGRIRVARGQVMDDESFYACDWAIAGVSGLGAT